MAPTRRAPMRCPNCGATMNHHAEKLVYTSDSSEPGMDPALGGYIDEMHACPACGSIAARRGA